MNKKIIQLEARSGNSWQLRNNHKIPVILYGFGIDKSISLCANDDIKNTFNKLGKFVYSTIFEVHTNDKTYTCIIKGIEKNALTENIIHIDFQSISENDKFMMYCPLNIINKDKCEALKSKAAMFIPQPVVQVQCSMKDFVSSVDIDISNVTKGQKIHTSDLPNIHFLKQSMLFTIR